MRNSLFLAGIIVQLAASRPVDVHDVEIASFDGLRLAATYYDPGRAGPGVVLFRNCDQGRASMDGFARKLAVRGAHVMVYDYREGQAAGRSWRDTRNGDAFTADDEAALVVLATQAGVAIENARLWRDIERAQQEIRRLEVLDERERIAKELHDGVIQSLFAVGMSLQGAAALAQDEGITIRIEGAVEDIDGAIRDLRNYIFGLRPGILADRQLDQALRELGAEFEQRSGVVTVVDVDAGIAAALASIASDVVQVTREALSNVGRHAEATTCRVSLRRGVEGAILVIDDDGRGFEPGTAGEGLGIGNLRDRVASLGGSLDVSSTAGEGTTVRAVLPL
jgi:signal transduction histidine kinase